MRARVVTIVTVTSYGVTTGELRLQTVTGYEKIGCKLRFVTCNQVTKTVTKRGCSKNLHIHNNDKKREARAYKGKTR